MRISLKKIIRCTSRLKGKIIGCFTLCNLILRKTAVLISEAKVSPGSQTSDLIYKCMIQLLLGLNGLVGLAWEMLSFVLFSTEKVFSNLCIKQVNEL